MPGRGIKSTSQTAFYQLADRCTLQTRKTFETVCDEHWNDKLLELAIYRDGTRVLDGENGHFVTKSDTMPKALRLNFALFGNHFTLHYAVLSR